MQNFRFPLPLSTPRGDAEQFKRAADSRQVLDSAWLIASSFVVVWLSEPLMEYQLLAHMRRHKSMYAGAYISGF
jgi:hypothetical protein